MLGDAYAHVVLTSSVLGLVNFLPGVDLLTLLFLKQRNAIKYVREEICGLLFFSSSYSPLPVEQFYSICFPVL